MIIVHPAIDPKSEKLQAIKESFHFYPEDKDATSFANDAFDQLLTIIAGLKMEIDELKKKDLLREQDEYRNSR